MLSVSDESFDARLEEREDVSDCTPLWSGDRYGLCLTLAVDDPGSAHVLGTGSEGVRGALTSSPFVRNRRGTEHAHIHV
jgi:hypothetical protein